MMKKVSSESDQSYGRYSFDYNYISHFP
jgi:hypothetical protein